MFPSHTTFDKPEKSVQETSGSFQTFVPERVPNTDTIEKKERPPISDRSAKRGENILPDHPKSVPSL